MSLLFLIPLLPLLGFAINGLAYPTLPKQIAGIIGTIPPLVAFALSLQLFLNFDGQAQILPIADWINVGDFNAPSHYGSGNFNSHLFNWVYVA
jgi:NADH-quinone oxidoreductase subunit L